MIQCEQCRRAEYREAHPWRALAAELGAELFRPRPSGAAAFISSYSSSLVIMLGAAAGGRTVTHYQQHRLEFIRTGEQVEFDRMLRAVNDASLSGSRADNETHGYPGSDREQPG